MTTIFHRLVLPDQGLLFDLEQLYRCLQTLPDRRKRRGRRYPLAVLLMIGVLAKLAGQDSSRALAHWAKLRQKDLSQLFQLKRERMPHSSTWSRVLARAVSQEEVEQVVSQFFTQEKARKPPKRGSLQVCLDGKTLRGTIPAGQSQGVHPAFGLPPGARRGAHANGGGREDQRDYRRSPGGADARSAWGGRHRRRHASAAQAEPRRSSTRMATMCGRPKTINLSCARRLPCSLRPSRAGQAGRPCLAIFTGPRPSLQGMDAWRSAPSR